MLHSWPSTSSVGTQISVDGVEPSISSETFSTGPRVAIDVVELDHIANRAAPNGDMTFLHINVESWISTDQEDTYYVKSESCLSSGLTQAQRANSPTLPTRYVQRQRIMICVSGCVGS